MEAVSIIIVSYNTREILRECLAAVEGCSAAGTEVIVVDNASGDGSAAMVRSAFPNVRLIESGSNLGFGVANNLGVRAASHPWILLLNSDAIVREDLASGLRDYLLEHPDVACVGPRVILPGTGALQDKAFGHAPSAWRVLMQSLGINRLFPRSHLLAGVDGDHRWAEEMSVGWISGVCMAMRRRDFLEVGGFDARFFMYCEDVELCLKLAPRGRTVLLDRFEVMHYGGASSRSTAARVRNSLWQQRHLLMVVRDYYGERSAVCARLAVALGMTLRLLGGLARIPRQGVRDNQLLQSAWARLKDAVQFNGLPHADGLQQGHGK